MDAVKGQLKRMYLFLAFAYMCGLGICLIWQTSALASFTLGVAVSGLNFYLTYISFVKLYQPALGAKHVLLAGPLPKLLTIIIGTVICYQLPMFFLLVPFLLGICLYPFGYLWVSLLDYITISRR